MPTVGGGGGVAESVFLFLVVKERPGLSFFLPLSLFIYFCWRGGGGASFCDGQNLGSECLVPSRWVSIFSQKLTTVARVTSWIGEGLQLNRLAVQTSWRVGEMG